MFNLYELVIIRDGTDKNRIAGIAAFKDGKYRVSFAFPGISGTCQGFYAPEELRRPNPHERQILALGWGTDAFKGHYADFAIVIPPVPENYLTSLP